MECDSCGTPVYDQQHDQQLMQYDRTYSQAMDHLAAGNWEQAINLLRPLMNQYPTEKKLYLAALRAATRDFSDIGMENTVNRAIASETWRKLKRLNVMTGEMLRYSRRRYDKHREELGKQRTTILTWIFAAAACSLLAGMFLCAECYLLSMLCAAGLVGCLYKAVCFQPVTVLKKLMNTAPDYQDDPFT